VFGRLAGYEDVNDADRLGPDPAMRWIVGGRAVTDQAASTSQMGRFETSAMTSPTNLTALADLSGRWIDRVQARRAATVLVLDIDSSVSPTYGEQEGTAHNGHFECTCYHPIFAFNQDGDLERCALRPGNVHSAHGWREVLDPVVARHRGQALRRLLRDDAAFALPDVYEYLEAEGFQYAIRLPANAVLQERIASLLTRPVGRPPHYVRRFYASFRYQAQSWSRSRRVVAKVEWHPGELYPRVGFIVTNLRRLAKKVLAFYNRRGTAEQWIKEGKQAIKWTRLSCVSFRANAVPAHPSVAQGDGAVVAHKPAGEGGEDRGEGRRPRPLPRLPDGRGGGAPGAVPGYPPSDREAATSGAGPMLTLDGYGGRKPGVEMRPECVRGVPMSSRNALLQGSRSPWRTVQAGALPCPTAEDPCLRGREDSIQARRRTWAPSIWEMSA
jgi:hypothetical protein